VKKFDMSSAWDDVVQLLRWETGLTLPVVGILVLLPALAFAILGPAPTEPPPGADINVIAGLLRADIARLAPYLLVLAMLSSLGALAVSRLWLAPGGTSVAEALAFAAGLLPMLVILFMLQVVALGIAFLVFFVPALYLGGRLAPTIALIAAGDTRSPIDALKQSWAITRGNGWRIALMLILVQLVMAIVTMLIDGTGSLLGAHGTPGHAIASLISAAVAGVAALVSYALGAAVYRQLAPSGVVRTFD
jgi:hypothetical protein